MLIALDLMDTLLTDPFVAAHEAACGRTFAEFEAVRPDGVYHRLERGGILESEYWASLVAAGLDWDADRFHRTRRAGYRWIAGMHDLVTDCVAGNRVVIASNYPVWIEEVVRDHLAGFDVDVFASCFVGVRKPTPRFFALLADHMRVPIEEVVLVDDKQAAVETVRAMGGAGVHFTSADAARAELHRAGAAGV